MQHAHVGTLWLANVFPPKAGKWDLRSRLHGLAGWTGDKGSVREKLEAMLSSMDQAHQIDIGAVHPHSSEGGGFVEFSSVTHDAGTVAELLAKHLTKERMSITSFLMADDVRVHLVQTSAPFKHDLTLNPVQCLLSDRSVVARGCLYP
jgi:hypothetical protein